jgi:hypothetical protein
MEKFQNVLRGIKGLTLKETNDKINQVQRNEMKASVLDALQADFAGVTNVARTKDGLVLEIQNDEIGTFYAVVDFTIKNLDYDLDGAIVDYNESIAERERKAQAKADKVKASKGE